MSRSRRLASLAAAILTVVAAAPGHADERPSRSAWLAPTYQLSLSNDLPSSAHGVGAGASYEFHVSPMFNVGLGLAYRFFPGGQSTQQLGYGAILKHFFSPAWSCEDGIYPYVDYGLLLQQTFVEGRNGSAVSHDTRLGGGALVRYRGVPLFIALAGHYSRIQYFDTESIWVPYLDVAVGWVHAF